MSIFSCVTSRASARRCGSGSDRNCSVRSAPPCLRGSLLEPARNQHAAVDGPTAQGEAMAYAERAFHDQWVPPWVRHQTLGRYEWASEMVKGRKVIEVACGT